MKLLIAVPSRETMRVEFVRSLMHLTGWLNENKVWYEVKIISGKAVVKGRVQARVLYRTQPGYRLDTLRQEIPFNQIVDLDGVGEDCVCFAAVEQSADLKIKYQEE